MTATEPSILPPVPGAHLWPLSVGAYHALGELGLIPEKTELLYGFVCHKMPKSPLHSWLIQRLFNLLQARLPEGHALRQEQPITTVDSEPEPDLAIVRGSADAFRHEHPRTAELVVEVCVTSHEYDRSKLAAYAAAGVKECWLVLGPERQVEIFRHPAGERFTETSIVADGQRLVAEAVPSVTVEVGSLFA